MKKPPLVPFSLIGLFASLLTLSAQEPITSGEGDFRYEYVPAKLTLPDGLQIVHAHGVCKDPDGNIYMTYTSKDVNANTRAVVRWDAKGENGMLIGKDNTLAVGSPHGIDCVVEDGTTYLYHSNTAGILHKTQLDGTIVWTRKGGPQEGAYKPTDTTSAPKSEELMVADGYASSLIFSMNTSDGKDRGPAWGAKGKDDGQFQTSHGMVFDTRHNQIVIADRENHRIQFFDTDKKHLKTIQNKGTGRPVNVDVWSDYLLVSNLNGPVAIFNKANEMVSMIEVAKLLGAKGHKMPHDAIFLDNGDVVVGTYNPGRMSYWKRLPVAK